MKYENRFRGRFTNRIDDTMDAQLAHICELVRIPSVSRGTPEPGKPLGRNVDAALQKALGIANELGFTDTRSLDGYCGIVDYGEGDELLCVMAHLDVVPAGEGWTSAPFEPEIRDGRLYGRGVEDDKGPAVSALYALAAIKDAGIPLKRKVRILLGCDEEVGMACIERYLQTEREPDLAFTPDGSYPMVNSEMNIGHVTFRKALQGSDVRIRVGTAANVVPGTAEAEMTVSPCSCSAPCGMDLTISGNTVRVTGFGAHASIPDTGKNALSGLFEVLSRQPLSEETSGMFKGLHELFGYDTHGQGFSLDVTDASGRLTLVPSMFTVTENEAVLTMDSRYPFAITDEELLAKLDAKLNAMGFVRTETSLSHGHYIAKDCELAGTLLKVYEDNVGHPAAPEAIGGGTYARDFKNAVAFGPTPEGETQTCHMPDEYMSLQNIRFNTIVMAEGIAALAAE